MAKKTITETLEIPQGIEISIDTFKVSIKGPKGEVHRDFNNPKVQIKTDGKLVILDAQNGSKRDKAVIKTYKAHIQNAIVGCQEAFVYKLKICSGHFPMNVSVSNNQLEIKNFLGEKVPRKVKLNPNAKIIIDGSMITVEATDKEIAGQAAADIEQATRRPGFDKRIFQDGIYMIEKAGKMI